MKFYNKTRKSKSILKRLLKEKKFHLIPAYYLALSSYLGKEGIHNGGSHKFADHIYEKKHKGKFLFGKIIDWGFLRLKSARAMRARYIHAKNEIKKYIDEHKKDSEIHILAVPSGYAREMFEVHDELKQKKHPKYSKIYWHLLDLNQDLIKEIKQTKNPSEKFNFWIGDALNQKSFVTKHKFDIIISLGFTDFVDEEKTLQFYKIVKQNLIEDGIFINSSMKKYWLSDYLLTNIAELNTIYRTKEELLKLIKKAGFSSYNSYNDKTKILSTVIAKNKK